MDGNQTNSSNQNSGNHSDNKVSEMGHCLDLPRDDDDVYFSK